MEFFKILLPYISLVKTLKVFLANRDFTKAQETFRVSVYSREFKIYFTPVAVLGGGDAAGA